MDARMKRLYCAIDSSISVIAGIARCCRRSIQKWIPVPGSGELSPEV
jgi:hypothetical protein